MEKHIAAFLQAGAAVLFVSAGIGAGVDDVYGLVFGLPAVGSAIAGLLLWGRAAQRSLPARDEPAALGAQVERVEERLIALQDEVARLREDRDFFQALYSGRGENPRSLPEARDG